MSTRSKNPNFSIVYSFFTLQIPQSVTRNEETPRSGVLLE